MIKLVLTWNLINETQEYRAERYCHNCGRKVFFEDSLIRRHNANGKDIFQFAIYKCPKGHTWNKKLDQYKAKTETFDHTYLDVLGNDGELTVEGIRNEGQLQKGSVERISLCTCLYTGIAEIIITIQQLSGDWRLDKTLAERIDDMSRTQLNKLITEGSIQVNQQQVKPNRKIKKQDQIYIDLTKIDE